MKRILHASVLIVTILGWLSSGTPALAATGGNQAILSLADLGSASDIILHGPYDTSNLRFDVPATWSLQDGAELDLMISSYSAGGDTATGTTAAPAPTNGYVGALLDVYFNNRLQQSVELQNGENMIYRVPIRAADLSARNIAGTLDISFFLNAAIDCNYAFHHTTVMISQTSQAVLPYVETPVHYDLHRLPWPLFQTGLHTPEPAVVVVPSQASAAELQAALVTMASMARMSGSLMPISMMTTDEFTLAVQKQSNAILVGKAASLPLLAGAALPAPVQGSKFSAPEMQADDGLVEAAVSPWNPLKSILIVGGNSDAAVVKAARALSTSNLQTGTSLAYSVVADVNPAAAQGTPPASSADRTLQDLAYKTDSITGVGTNWFGYNFTIPAGQVPTEVPSMKLLYSNSALVDSTRSGAVLYLNGDLVGSVRFADDNANAATATINLPISSFRPGNNRIDIAATLLPHDVCSVFTFNGLWMTVYPGSTLHLPLAPASKTAFTLQDLASFPIPFANDPSLATTTFVLPKNDHRAWDVAGEVAYGMGAQASGPTLAFDTAFDGEIPDAAHQHDLIIVGLPTELSTLQLKEFSDKLPAHYDKNSNVAILQSQEIVYRVGANKDLGYLQLLTSPWDSQHAVMAVLGTSGNGLASAGDAITQAPIRNSLKGNFVTVDGVSTVVVDTRSGLGVSHLEAPAVATSVSALPTAVSGNQGQTAVQSALQQKQLVLGGLVAIVVLMIALGGVALALRRRVR